MISSLERAFDLLELIASSPTPLQSGALAKALGLHPATCSNLIKTLVTRGYLNQVAPRKGYELGPMAYYLARGGPWRKDLVTVAGPHMAALARKTEESVVLATLHQGRWYQLAEIRGDQPVQVNAEGGGEQVYRTATGRLLLALMPEETLIVTRRYGYPTREVWPQVHDLTSFVEFRQAVRDDGGLVESSTGPAGVARVAFPIREGEKVVAALGVYLPEFRFVGAHQTEVVTQAYKAAKDIGEELGRRR
jgi:DNA-binding IclR family transcriptional regulator